MTLALEQSRNSVGNAFNEFPTVTTLITDFSSNDKIIIAQSTTQNVTMVAKESEQNVTKTKTENKISMRLFAFHGT